MSTFRKFHELFFYVHTNRDVFEGGYKCRHLIKKPIKTFIITFQCFSWLINPIRSRVELQWFWVISQDLRNVPMIDCFRGFALERKVASRKRDASAASCKVGGWACFSVIWYSSDWTVSRSTARVSSCDAFRFGVVSKKQCFVPKTHLIIQERSNFWPGRTNIVLE